MEAQSHVNPDGPPGLLLDDPDADVILRSCDLQEFRLLKIYLIKNSPVFSELIQSAAINVGVPDSSPPLHAGALPYIQLSESGAIISSLLSFILPVHSFLQLPNKSRSFYPWLKSTRRSLL